MIKKKFPWCEVRLKGNIKKRFLKVFTALLKVNGIMSKERNFIDFINCAFIKWDAAIWLVASEFVSEEFEHIYQTYQTWNRDIVG